MDVTVGDLIGFLQGFELDSEAQVYVEVPDPNAPETASDRGLFFKVSDVTGNVPFGMDHDPSPRLVIHSGELNTAAIDLATGSPDTPLRLDNA